MRKLLLSLILVSLMVRFGYADVDESLVLYLPFDEGQGDLSEDQSMYGNDATVNTDWDDGHSGKAVAIEGQADNLVIVEHAESLIMNGEVTLLAWIQPTGAWGGGIKTVAGVPVGAEGKAAEPYESGMFDEVGVEVGHMNALLIELE